jgi:hypothetical protein
MQKEIFFFFKNKKIADLVFIDLPFKTNLILIIKAGLDIFKAFR